MVSRIDEKETSIYHLQGISYTVFPHYILKNSPSNKMNVYISFIQQLGILTFSYKHLQHLFRIIKHPIWVNGFPFSFSD